MSTPPASSAPGSAARPKVEVFAVHGVDPEVQAYAMAKYSRSALSMKESLRQLNEQKAEQFLNTFYFQYGHRSIADLAHLAIAVERLSILAAIVLVDEQRWDGQERSTRYQNFRKSGYYVPEFADAEAEKIYRLACDFLFAEYEAFSKLMAEHLKGLAPRPDDMPQEAYDRTLRARAFDIARYLLPMATNTSLGQIVNARTLETQISRLLSHTHPEVRELGGLLKSAAREPAYNLMSEAVRPLIEEIRARDPELAERAAALLLRDVKAAPTLVKYADASPYLADSRRMLVQAAAELMGDEKIQPAELVELLDPEPLETELATTLLYQHSHYPYRQLRQAVESLGEARRQEIVDLGLRHRGRHDELLRAFCAGQHFRFDILMDVGGFRDMHRHRRCIQILQPFAGALHGHALPPEIAAAGEQARYDAAMQHAAQAQNRLVRQLESGGSAAGVGQATFLSDYLSPLGFRQRALFKMDFAEVVYISELRTTPAGHQSYREVAYAMYQQAVRRHPGLKSAFRVTDVHQPVDLLQR